MEACLFAESLEALLGAAEEQSAAGSVAVESAPSQEAQSDHPETARLELAVGEPQETYLPESPYPPVADEALEEAGTPPLTPEKLVVHPAPLR